MIRIEFLAPQGFSWTPGQHCFLRFPAISLLDNHPFTIMSPPAPELGRKAEDSATLTFLARQHAGFTRALAVHCASSPDSLLSGWIDGPYGGVGRFIERLYDTMILVAGGAGITACLPWLLHVVEKSRSRAPDCQLRVRSVVLVWIIKEATHLAWVEKSLAALSGLADCSVSVQVKIFVTGDKEVNLQHALSAAAEKDLEAGAETISATVATPQVVLPHPSPSAMAVLDNISHGRPALSPLLKQHLSPCRTFILGCGPQSLRDDLANACAGAQALVLRGEVKEVAMHLEAFGW